MVQYKSEFPRGPERKALLKDAKQLSQEFAKGGAALLHDEYTWLDSSLDVSEDGSKPFRATFKGVLPEGTKSLRKYLEQSLKKFKGERIFIEFGGVGSKIAQDFSPEFFTASYGVTIADHDTLPESMGRLAVRHAMDAVIGHTVLEGDVLKDATYDDLEERLGSKKAALVIERMAKGLRNVPIEPYAVSKLFQRWYDLVGEGGILLAQVPVGFNALLEAWADLILRECGDTLEIRIHVSVTEESHGESSSSIFIQKKEGAPEKLPLLDPSTVKAIGEEGYQSTSRVG